MKVNILVSVIIPTFNRELIISKTLRSFLNQKNRLTENLSIVKELKSNYTIHNIYGNIKTSLFKKLVHFHTSYHFNQFGIL